eukprot:CAMPEP_0174947184 /NCGR_PEP_ID=MMETSP1355-20121228/86033_1 /TAXON_ID=464990 /ORGANISM="Hemiselmis tepida, Strain CCMP443" /LENGTH=45 /DNA_ID= /DNA_START= /DNA_END= /DNA_ORIENTATION=
MAGDEESHGLTLAMTLPVLLCVLGVGGCAWYQQIRQQREAERRQQ